MRLADLSDGGHAGGVAGSSSRAARAAMIFFGTPPGTSPQHRVQAADDLGAGTAQVAVALGPELQHCRVVVRPGFADAGRPQWGL